MTYEHQILLRVVHCTCLQPDLVLLILVRSWYPNVGVIADSGRIGKEQKSTAKSGLLAKVTNPSNISI